MAVSRDFRRYRAGCCDIAAWQSAENTDRRRKRHRDQKPDKAEQVAEGKQRKHQPDRMQTDPLADEFRCENIAFQELSHQEDREHDDDPSKSGENCATATASESTSPVIDPT